MTDSYHFESVAKFRVGGVYRQQNGVVVRLEGRADNATAQAVRCESNPKGYNKNSGGARRLSDGRYVFQAANDYYECHLIPGELIQRDGEWVPAASIGPFPSGATLTTSGDKIVGRVEAEQEAFSTAIDRLAAQIEADLMKGLMPVPEPKRAPLPHFNQRTAHDPFGDGFIVTKGAVEVTPTSSPTTDSAYPAIAGLLRVSDGGPANASASLLLKTA